MVNLTKRRKKDRRVPTRLRFKIAKKVRQHNAKQRREDRKNRSQIAKKYNKAIVLPNACPFKEDIIKEAQETKLREKAEVAKHLINVSKEKEAAKKEAEEMESKDFLTEMLERKQKRTLAHYIRNVQSRQDEHDRNGGEETDAVGAASTSNTKVSPNSEQSLKAYYKEFKMVVDAADVILEVVDARDPLGTRCVQVEEAVKNARGQKRLVIVLNKADLVPNEVLKKWLNYLRKSVPAVPFKASTQKQKNNLCQRKMKSKGRMRTRLQTTYSPCVGAEILMSLLKNYCRSGDVKTQIHVGIVGLPNVGKSSIINSLKRKRACYVSAAPGSTKISEVIHLDRNIKLLDSPGIVFGSSYRHVRDSDATNVLKNAVNVNKISDPVAPATAILQRANKMQMVEKYNLPEYDTPEEFFYSLAKKSGFYSKTGVPDLARAAKEILSDWTRGKLRYYTLPPESDDDDAHVSAAIVKETSQEFNLDSLKEQEDQFLDELEAYVQRSTSKRQKEDEPIVMEPSAPVHAVELNEQMNETESPVDDEAETDEDETDDEIDDDVEKMDEDNPGGDSLLSGNITVTAVKTKRSKQRDGRKKSGVEESKEKSWKEIKGNQRLNSLRKLDFKKKKKIEARTAKRAVSLSAGLESVSLSGSTDNDSYDFRTDFVSQQ